MHWGKIFVLCYSLLPILSYGQNPVKIISDEDLTNQSTIWNADTTYLLDGLVYLESEGSLTIEAGTVIKAKQMPTNGDSISALVITKGSKLLARGEYFNPIIFTSEWDDVTDPGDLTGEYDGLWGGIIILGASTVYDSSGAPFLAKHPSLPAEDERAVYGGEDPGDDSGILSCISIRYAGASVSSWQFDGLSLAGVGSRSRLDSIEVFYSGNDGFSFLGGTTNSRNLVSSFCRDDNFSWSNGFTGKGQFWFGLQGEQYGDCVMEGRGLFSNPTIYNATLIGSGIESQNERSLAIRLEEGSGLHLGMSIIADFPFKGLQVEDLIDTPDSYSKLNSGQVKFNSNIWTDLGSGLDFEIDIGIIQVDSLAEDPEAIGLKDHLTQSDFLEINYLPFISRKQKYFLYPDDLVDPLEAPPLSYPDDPFFLQSLGSPCQGRGAFITNGSWWLLHWTALDQDGYLMHPCALDFYNDPRWEFINEDTMILDCQMIDQLNFEYDCFNSRCVYPNQSLSLAMRNKRKKKGLIGMPENSYCYTEEFEFTGIENLLFLPEYSDLSDPTFSVTITALVRDELPPEFVVENCDSCSLPIRVRSTDCDTSWVEGPMISIINDTVTEYTWEAEDRCGNTNILSLYFDANQDLKQWYEDQDNDGYGNDDRSIFWPDSLPGFTLTSGDCDDLNKDISPGIPENPFDNFDNDCSGGGNIERCTNSDELNVLPQCDPISYAIYNPQLESNSSNNSCLSILPEFDGDIWFSGKINESGILNLEINADFSTSFKVYRGNCDELELITCVDFQNSIELNNLDPEETVHIQTIVSNYLSDTFTICATAPGTATKINNRKLTEPIIYPNPGTGLFYLRTDDHLTNNFSIAIYSVNGQLIRTPIQRESCESDLLKIDLTDLQSGYYWIAIQDSHSRKIGKIIKM